MSAPVCDILLLTWNRPDLLRPCVEHVLRHTVVPSRLLIIDNGSTDPALAAYLPTIPSTPAVQVEHLRLNPNRGFAGGMNAGLAAARAPWVCLLSNDVLVYPGWLKQMLHAASLLPDIGLINPQGLSPRPDQIPSFMPIIYQTPTEALIEVGMCIGYCMLGQRELFARFGGLSEEVGPGYFEDEDLSMRVRAAGLRCVVARGAGVHHAERQTFGVGAGQRRLFDQNRAWCEQRWGRWVRMAWPCFEPLVPGSAALARQLAQLQPWLQRRTYVDLIASGPKALGAGDLFRSVGLVPHADVRWRRVPAQAVAATAALGILKRRKKRYDIVIAPHAAWAAGMQRLRWWHGAVVVQVGETEVLEQAWQTRSRFQLSS